MYLFDILTRFWEILLGLIVPIMVNLIPPTYALYFSQYINCSSLSSHKVSSASLNLARSKINVTHVRGNFLSAHKR